MTDVFDQTLIAAADAFFELPGAEWVSYLPRGGASRRIRAVVTRPEAGAIDGLAGGSRPRFELLVKNDSDEGISSDELDTGGDKARLGPRVDTKPQTLRLVELLNQDAGLILIAAQ